MQESYADVVKPELKGKTIASDLTKSLTYTNTVIALEQAGLLELKPFWDNLKATEPSVVVVDSPLNLAMVSGLPKKTQRSLLGQ